MKKFKWVFLCAFVFIAFLVFSFRPVPDVALNECHQATGVFLGVETMENTEGDLKINFKNDGNHYYINRGLEQASVYEKLKSGDFEGMEITVFYVEHWSLLNPSGSYRPIKAIKHKDDFIYNSEK